MRITALFTCALLLPLAGCLTSRIEKVGAETYRLQQKYQTREELRAAIEGHEREAEKLCSTGYFKSKDYDRIDGSARILVWEIACDTQYRPQKGATKSDPV